MGLFDVFMPQDTNIIISSQLAEAHGLDDISFVLYMSGISGFLKKVVQCSQLYWWVPGA